MEDQSGHRKLTPTHLFNQNPSIRPPRVVDSEVRHTYKLQDGSSVHDFSSGAGVASLGRHQDRVEDAIVHQLRLGASYVPSLAFSTPIAEELARLMILSTGRKMNKAIFYCSGNNSTLP
jgi:adenosylmethionine-8-amino-7-oxononanoate aminotransferase